MESTRSGPAVLGVFYEHCALPTIVYVAASTASSEVLLVVATLGRRISHLRDALASIRAQSVGSDVVIVSPSTSDDLAEIVEAFGARLLPDPGSLPAAINFGMDRGLDEQRFVGWLNDDDLLEEGSLATTTAALDATPDAVMAFGACRYIDRHGNPLWVSKAGPWAPRILGWGPDLIPQPGMLIRSSAWRQVGGLDTSYSMAFDLDLLLRLRKIGRLLDTGEVVSSFRWHKDSLTVDDRAKNISESERARRAALGPLGRTFAWLWERPVRIATHLAVREVNRRAARLAAG